MSAEEWTTLNKEFGSIMLDTAVIRKLKSDLAQCYKAIMACKTDKALVCTLSDESFGNFSIYLPISGIEEDDNNVHILYRVPESDIVHTEDSWSISIGSESHFVGAWLREFSGNPLKPIVYKDSDPPQKSWFPFSRDQSILVYFRLDFSRNGCKCEKKTTESLE